MYIQKKNGQLDVNVRCKASWSDILFSGASPGLAWASPTVSRTL